MQNNEVAFNRRFEYNFKYVCNALLLADVDGDGALELAAGSRDGALCIFKMDRADPWKTTMPVTQASSQMGGPFGLIAALACGDLFNKNAPVLVSIAADGSLYACRVQQNSTQDSPILQPCFKQLLPSNIKCAYIGDIDGDSRTELIVALTDRVVRMYRFLSCTTSSTSSTSSSSSVHRANASSSNFCCGYLVALNKWESPAQITAFSICSSGPMAEAGATVLLSQPGDKYLLLKPKLCPENDPADNLTDISVVYCETNQQKCALKASQMTTVEHQTDKKVVTSSSRLNTIKDAAKRNKRRLFIAANSYCVNLFHLTTRYVTVVDHSDEKRVEFPTQIFNLAQIRAAYVDSDCVKNYRELLLACDWSNNVYVCATDSTSSTVNSKDSSERSAEEKRQRITSLVTLKVFGPIMCFAAGYDESSQPDDVFVAVHTCEQKLFVYGVRSSKVLRFLSQS